MSLYFPHQYPDMNSNHDQSISRQNLDKLYATLSTGQKLTSKDVVTETALQSFEFIKGNRNGCAHRCKKYTAALTTFTASYVLPIGGAIGLAYNYLNKESIKGFATTPYASTIAAGTGALLVVDRAAKAASGVSLIRPMLNSIGTGYALLVNTLVNNVMSTYDKDSDKKEEVNAGIHKAAVANLKSTYDGEADALKALFEKAKNNPKQLLELKNYSNTFLNEFKQFSTCFKEFDKDLKEQKLNNAEIGSILNKFKSTLEYIRGEKIVLRSGSSEEDMAFNIDLLINFPITQANCLPASAQQHIAAAKAHELGLLHIAKHCIATTVSGVISLAAVPATAFAGSLACTSISLPLVGPITAVSTSTFCSYAKNPLDSLYTSLNDFWSKHALDKTTVGIGIAGFAVSALIARKVYQSYQKERMDSNHVVEILNKKAITEILSVYENLAGHFRQQLTKVKHDPKKLDCLKYDVEIICSKLEDIIKGLNDSGIKDFESEAATTELQAALLEIITSEFGKC